MLTLDQLGISESDWNQMPPSSRVTIMFLLKQNQLLENRTYTFHLEVERLKTELERRTCGNLLKNVSCLVALITGAFSLPRWPAMIGLILTLALAAYSYWAFSTY